MENICEKEVRKRFKRLSADIREVREDVRSNQIFEKFEKMSKVITKIVSKNSSKEKKAVSKGKIITDNALKERTPSIMQISLGNFSHILLLCLSKPMQII